MWTSFRRHAVAATTGALFVSLFGVVLAQIVLRSAGHTLIWAEEYASVAFIWLVFSGAALACQRREHLDVDLVYTAVAGSSRRIPAWDTGIALFQIFFLAVFAIGLVQMAAQTWGNSMGALRGFRYGWIYLGALVADLTYMGFLVAQILSDRRKSGQAARS
ncbi:TRAP-type C4-dicarboxylate transport system permease small subunit [Hoeflea marina]|uniref:TRAP transporter small permease protein n=1 Tax=Hoeflea marina TaxID=274592 RepID=A0A317PLB3_9HYPH|nr:TRAP transporter small permease subunit [Hoeflea marina]PWW00616.1 TRAP-type C4-dicarboxylate transport system permease small subunit [Hoeflea marina]